LRVPDTAAWWVLQTSGAYSGGGVVERLDDGEIREPDCDSEQLAALFTGSNAPASTMQLLDWILDHDCRGRRAILWAVDVITEAEWDEAIDDDDARAPVSDEEQVRRVYEREAPAHSQMNDPVAARERDDVDSDVAFERRRTAMGYGDEGWPVAEDVWCLRLHLEREHEGEPRLEHWSTAFRRAARVLRSTFEADTEVELLVAGSRGPGLSSLTGALLEESADVASVCCGRERPLELQWIAAHVRICALSTTRLVTGMIIDDFDRGVVPDWPWRIALLVDSSNGLTLRMAGGEVIDLFAADPEALRPLATKFADWVCRCEPGGNSTRLMDELARLSADS
jgi:hypothetical protein